MGGLDQTFRELVTKSGLDSGGGMRKRKGRNAGGELQVAVPIQLDSWRVMKEAGHGIQGKSDTFGPANLHLGVPLTDMEIGRRQFGLAEPQAPWAWPDIPAPCQPR